MGRVGAEAGDIQGAACVGQYGPGPPFQPGYMGVDKELFQGFAAPPGQGDGIPGLPGANHQGTGQGVPGQKYMVQTLRMGRRSGSRTAGDAPGAGLYRLFPVRVQGAGGQYGGLLPGAQHQIPYTRRAVRPWGRSTAAEGSPPRHRAVTARRWAAEN